jgi:chromosome partitioning protein
MHITLILNQKGGVGKSTTTMNLAAVTADVLGGKPGHEAPIAVSSIDPQGSIIWWCKRVGDDNLPFHYLDASKMGPKEIRALRKTPGIERMIFDTPGFMPENPDLDSIDPLGTGHTADMLRAVLDIADDVIVPIEPEPLAYSPTRTTVEEVVKPRDLPYAVLLNNWDPRDGERDRDQTLAFIDKSGWVRFQTVVRHYKLHTRAAADGQICTQYKPNRVSSEARSDFQKVALEHQLRIRGTAPANAAPKLAAVEGGGNA